LNKSLKINGGERKLSSGHELANIMRRKIKDIDPIVLAENSKYIAALLDGEGHFSIRPQHPPLSFYPLIALGMTHKKTIDSTAKIFGVSTYIVRNERPLKDCYRLRVTTQKECDQICEAISEYSITKSKQIKLLLRFLKLQKELETSSGKQERKRILFKMIDLYIACKKTNERGPTPDYDAMRNDMQEMVINDLARRFG
jgi:hypothetical protein